MVDKRVWIVLGAVLLCAGFAVSTPAEDPIVKATAKLIESFESRIDVMVEDVARDGLLGDADVESVCEELHAPVAAFFELHPLEQLPESPFGNAPSVFKHATFAEFLETEAWRAVLETQLAPDSRAALTERRERRVAALKDAVIELSTKLVAQGLVLTEDELVTLGPVIETACEDWLSEGAIAYDDPFNPGRGSRDALFEKLREAGLLSGLPEMRREVVAKIAGVKGRDTLDECLLEIEFYLATCEPGPDVERQRRLLRGAAEAKFWRDGRGPQPVSYRLFSVSAKGDRFWERALLGILDIPEGDELPALPSDDWKTLTEPRSTLLLAVLDLRACFSPEQLEALTPLVEKFAGRELQNAYSRGPLTPELPAVFGLNTETRFMSGPSPWSRPNPTQKAQVSTLLENCNAKQKETLDA